MLAIVHSSNNSGLYFEVLANVPHFKKVSETSVDISELIYAFPIVSCYTIIQ